LIITGGRSNNSFCAGGDIVSLTKMVKEEIMNSRGTNKTGVEIKGLIERVYSVHNFNYKCYYEVGELKCLKIALINGFCIGAGNAFLWGSDYQIVNDNSYF
jgi:enoyl-CoA hydratase/carnithine racemase